MKALKLYLLTAAIVISLSGNGQEKKSALFQKSTTTGGFGGISLNVNNYGRLNVSGEGAAIISNYYFGGFGYGADFGDFNPPNSDIIYEISLAEGGFLIGAISNNEHIIALFSEFRIGFGEAVAKSQIGSNIFEIYEENTFSITPKIGITVTLLKFIQLRVFTGYQWFNDIDLNGISEDVLNGFRWGFSVYFGYF